MLEVSYDPELTVGHLEIWSPDLDLGLDASRAQSIKDAVRFLLLWPVGLTWLWSLRQLLSTDSQSAWDGWMAENEISNE